jgi:hypothetical protein
MRGEKIEKKIPYISNAPVSINKSDRRFVLCIQISNGLTRSGEGPSDSQKSEGP